MQHRSVTQVCGSMKTTDVKIGLTGKVTKDVSFLMKETSSSLLDFLLLSTCISVLYYISVEVRHM